MNLVNVICRVFGHKVEVQITHKGGPRPYGQRPWRYAVVICRRSQAHQIQPTNRLRLPTVGVS